MAFLLPFLKSARNSLEGNNSLAALYQMSQQHLHGHPPHLLHPAIHGHDEQMYCSTTSLNNNNNNNINGNNELTGEVLEMKHSISENGDDEETIDAFDPAVANALGLKHAPPTPSFSISQVKGAAGGGGSPARSDTASADSMQNFIPDVQLAESGSQLIYNDEGRGTPPPLHYHPQMHPNSMAMGMEHRSSSFEPSVKRIKTECEATSTMTNGGGGSFYGGLTVSEMADMEFFRSILPDLAALTPQQRRKFKIGILELIDDVVTRYPAPERCNSVVNGSGGGSINGASSGRQSRRSSGREWRKQ